MMHLFSPAKLNLFLQILRRNDDGFHELASLFQAISFGDRLSISLAAHDRLLCNHSKIPNDRSNLIWKAIDLFRRKTGLLFSLEISLEKNIPLEAGLGGGSSNAATALWGVNALAGHPVAESELQQWAGEIGSDVAFFFSSGTAYCTGRGEKVQSLHPLRSEKVWIVKPQAGLKTAIVYQKLDAGSLPERDPLKSLASFLSDTSSGHYFNDLEVPAFALMPPLKKLKSTLLEQGFRQVLLSGSGTAFFCLGNGNPPSENLKAVSAHFLNRFPNKWFEPLLEQ